MGSSAASNPGTSWRKTKIGLSALALTLGIAAVVIGAVLPFVIDDKIDEGVRESVLLDPRTWSDTAEQNFFNQTTHEDFYVFNLVRGHLQLGPGEAVVVLAGTLACATGQNAHHQFFFAACPFAFVD